MKNMILIAFSLVFSGVIRANAVSPWLMGTLEGYHPLFYSSKIYLYTTSNFSDKVLADSALISENGNFAFALAPSNHTRLYFLQLPQSKPKEFIASSSDTLRINTTVAKFSTGEFQITGSSENHCYSLLQEAYHKYTMYLNARDSAVKAIPVFDKKYNTKTTAIRNSFFNQQVEVNSEIFKIINTKKASAYCKVVASLMYQPVKKTSKHLDTVFDNNLSFQHYHFFDSVTFNNKHIAAFPLLYEKIDYYFNTYVDAANFNGLKEGVDLLFSKIRDADVRDAVAYYLMGRYNKKNDYELVEYLFNNYYNSESCITAEKSEISELIDRMRAVAPGSTAPDIALPDADGKTVRLSDIKNKRVILVHFWASWCPHCTEAMPSVKKLYDMYSKDGLEIVGVSLDHTITEWQRYLHGKNLNWIQLAEGTGPHTATVKTYGVHGTPTYILMDGNKRILLRSTEFAEIEKKIKEMW